MSNSQSSPIFQLSCCRLNKGIAIEEQNAEKSIRVCMYPYCVGMSHAADLIRV